MMYLNLGKWSLLTLALVGATATAPTWSQQPPDANRRSELRYLLLQDCGSCHGMTLRGGLGPPLTDEALGDKPRDLLIATVLDGRRGTAMPPWRDFLTESEARWLVEALQRGDIDSSAAERSP